MSDLTILVIFFGGAAFGVVVTLIYWPWAEEKWWDNRNDR